MENAKQELLDMLKGKARMKCAYIKFNVLDEESDRVLLKLNHTPEELEEFLNKLDYNYDSGYGGQELFGTVWLDDGTWLTRGEYDGSEWWEHNKLPNIPADCL